MRRVFCIVVLAGIVQAGSMGGLAADVFPSAADLQAFDVIWQTISDTYFDRDFGGLDWTAVRDHYRPLVSAASDAAEYFALLNEMVFELERSHSAVIPPGDAGLFLPSVYASGSAGLDVRWLSGAVVVTSVQPGSQADEAGIRAGFEILSIDGVSVQEIISEAEAFSAPPFNDRGVGQSVNSALLGKIHGVARTRLTLTYEDDRGETGTAQITRRERRVASPTTDGSPPTCLEFESRWLDDCIGYIRFNTFHADLLPDFKQAVRTMETAGGLILDLRGNPGGQLDAMIQIAEHLLTERTVLLTVVMRHRSMEMPANPVDAPYSGPLVFLVDVLCTSGSEMLPISLQALGRATVVGERTQGAVTGANMTPLPNGATLMYPFVQTLAADGTDPEGIGVLPDTPATLSRDQLLEGIDAQLQAALDYLTGLNDASASGTTTP